MTTEVALSRPALHLALAAGPVRVKLVGSTPDGFLVVATREGERHTCEALEDTAAAAHSWQPGDELLAVLPPASEPGCVLGRISRVRSEPPAKVTIAAAQQLTLKCGDASVDLRADGKVMIRGDDVLVRAKGTQRIRAGVVAIN